MSLHIVADNTVELPVYNFQDIPACARRFAEQFEAGTHGEPATIILVAQHSDGIALSIWGENTSGFELIGILDAAKQRAYEALDSDD